MRFRSVSKSWKSLIHSTEFIRDHTSRRAQSQHLLIKYEGLDDSYRPHYVSIVDDDTFPQRKFSMTSAPLLPPPVTLPVSFKLSIIGGSSQGLFCFCRHHAFRNDDLETTMAVIWNPTLGKSVDIVVSKVQQYETVVGFGVCPHTCDPKLVKISYLKDPSSLDSIITIPWQIEVFSLSTRAWKSLSINLPRKSLRCRWDQVDIDGVIYWIVDDIANVDGEIPILCNNLIMSFDLTNEEFTEVYLPDKLAHALILSMSKLRESLAVLNCIFEDEIPVYEVWIMNNDDQKSFTHLFSIKPQDALLQNVLGFRKSGEPVIEMLEDDEHSSLFVYKSHSEHIDIGITGDATEFFVGSYMETLLLLDQ